MKIGIVTFHNVPNYGAMLQAYALWQYLRARSHEVFFIDLPLTTAKRYAFWKCFYVKPKNIFEARKIIKTKLNLYARFPITHFSQTYPKATLEDQFDAVIVGSDQMWNPKWVLNYLREVFLDFAAPNCIRIAYAPSFGVKEWGEKKRDEVGAMLKKFSAISVREESGRNIVQDLSSRQDAVCLLDPTLLHSATFYENLFPKSQKDDDYLFSYFLEEWTNDSTEAKACEKLCQALNLKIVKKDRCFARGLLGAICKLFGATAKIPLPDFLASIASARFVVTNSFHGTVFSIIFHRPFATFLLKGAAGDMNDRVVSLLTKLNLTDRICASDDFERLSALAKAPAINWAGVDARLNALRRETDDFFGKVI